MDKTKIEHAIKEIERIIMKSGGSPVLYKEIFDTIEEWNKQNSDLVQLLLSAFGKGDLGAVHLYYILLNLKFAMSGIQAMLTIEMQHEDHHKGYNLILKVIQNYINLWDNPQEGEKQFMKMSRNKDVRKTIPQLIEHIKSFHVLLKGLQGIVIKIQKFEEEKSADNSLNSDVN